jgi:virginiamycin A acetyltransferase
MIGPDVWIGAGAIVLKGVSIGAHAVVGAGSVVTGHVPPWAVVAGNPARVVKYLTAPDGETAIYT